MNHYKKVSSQKQFTRFTAGALILLLLISLNAPMHVQADTTNIESSQEIITSTVTDFEMVLEEGTVSVNGKINNHSFSASGAVYNIYDHLYPDKYYFIENDPDYDQPVVIINLEFELNAKEDNLEVANQHLSGQNVMRLAAYIGGTFYYAEQTYQLDSRIISTATALSVHSNSPVMQSIISASTWFMKLGSQQPAPYSTDCAAPALLSMNTTYDNIVSPSAVILPDLMDEPSSPPNLSDALDAVDIDTINAIGASNFIKEQFVTGWTSNGGYVLKGYEWPADSGSITILCLYYSIVKKAPSLSTNSYEASIEFELVVDRQYRWIPSTNTIEPDLYGSDYAIYDLKLALECTQYTTGNGYDYIHKRVVSSDSESGDGTPLPVKLALSVAKQYDKYGIITYVEDIFNAFSTEDSVDLDTTCSWPDDWNDHYTAFTKGKRANTMIRGVRIDTTSHIIQDEGHRITLVAGIVDRDYANSTTNASMTKAIRYAVSYNLRYRNSVWGWIFDGDDCEDVTKESYKFYTI